MADSYRGFKSKEGYELYQSAYQKVMKLWETPYQERIITTTFGDISVLECGNQDKEPLLFFHAFGFSSAEWYKCAEELADEFKLYFVDVLGEFNQSNTKEHLNEREDYIMWITELLNELKIAKVTIVGHSNGGWHALNFAILKPDRVKSLIVFSPAASIKRMNLSFYSRLLLTNLIPSESVIISQFCRWLTVKKEEGQERLFKLYYLGQKHVTWEYVMTPPKLFKDHELDTLMMPVHIAVGRDEVIYDPYTLLKKAEDKIRGCKTHMFDSGGHMLPIEIPGEVSSFIKKVLADIK
ncbi:alpha/beta fold hydrolase [Jeotgalibacillus haloalkalitolerans]|uniref:Alpha/beta hydrolase n=1 Tax=Jeotgalibacillus haloalkalitolerans TaxID=3104292 RepID=A0ABU5KKN1_9BACL|nr:alpha/beta hydrolase [Jeotgalibacillus sp. HH7-29]MDZ5711818.1 alpha/beta hydrolase [Jeotgalibacillus sp. HH7-29]